MNRRWVIAAALGVGMLVGFAAGQFSDDVAFSTHLASKATETFSASADWTKDKAKEAREWVSKRLPGAGDAREPKQSHPPFFIQGE